MIPFKQHVQDDDITSCPWVGSAAVSAVPYLLKLLLGLLLHPPDVLHGQPDPFVHPAEQLAVEVGENALFLLRKGEKFMITDN